MNRRKEAETGRHPSLVLVAGGDEDEGFDFINEFLSSLAHRPPKRRHDGTSPLRQPGEANKPGEPNKADPPPRPVCAKDPVLEAEVMLDEIISKVDLARRLTHVALEDRRLAELASNDRPQTEIARSLGRSKTWVSRRIKWLRSHPAMRRLAAEHGYLTDQGEEK